MEGMDVAVSEFRARLSDWLARVRDGQEVVLTERGVPVARVVGLDATLIERLVQEGVIARGQPQPRPPAAGRPRPRTRRPLSDRVSEDRR